MQRLALRCVLAWIVFGFSAIELRCGEKPLWIHPGHVGGIGDSAFTTNFYLTAGFDGMIKAWDARTFEFSHTIPVHQRDPVRGQIAISADEKYVAHSSIRGVYISEIATGRLLAAIPEGQALIAFEPGSNLLVTTAGKRRAYWNIAGQLEKEVELAEPATTPWPEWPDGDEAYSPDNMERATVSGAQLEQRSVATGELIRTIALPQESTWYSLYHSTVAYSRDGKFLAAGAMVFDAKTGAVVNTLLAKSQVADVASRGVSTTFGWPSTVIAADDNDLTQFDYESGQVVARFPNAPRRSFFSTPIWLSPSGDLLMTETHVVKLASGETMRAFSNRVIAVDRLWSMMVDETVPDNSVGRLARYADGSTIATFVAPGSREASTAAFSPDATLVATGGGFTNGIMFDAGDPAVRLWSVPSGMLVRTLRGSGTGAAKVVRFSPDGRFLASVANPYNIELNVWSVENGELQLSMQLPGAQHYADEVPAAIGLFGDKPWVACADMKGIAVWDIESRKQVFRMDTETQGITDLNVTPDGQRMIIGRADGTVAMLAVSRDNRFVAPVVDVENNRVAVGFLGRGSYQFYHSTDLQSWEPVTGFSRTNDTYSAQFPVGERGYFRAVRTD